MARQTWDGGYIHTQKDGKRLYILEKKRGGRKFHISTKCHSETAAHEHWRRFQADPWKYAAEMEEGRPSEAEGVFLTDDLAKEFFAWHLNQVSRKHAKEVGKRLSMWIPLLRGVDLRKATLRDDIKPALVSLKTMRAHHISTIKVFYSWLRKERHLVRSAEDPTLDLPVPQSMPEKRRRRKAVPISHIQKVLPLLGPNHRDILMVLAHTALHFTELERLVRSPESEIVRVKRGTTLGLLVLRHKNGEEVRHPVLDRAVLEAAERLRRTGIAREVPPCAPEGEKPMRPNRALRYACARAGVPIFKLGVIRHSVGTSLSERGLSEGEIAAFLHHKDPRTTARFYIDVQVPTVAISPPRLRLVSGR